MLKELSKKDKLWREIAFKICKDRTLADDIVQEMYIRRSGVDRRQSNGRGVSHDARESNGKGVSNDRGQKTTDYYIVCTMKSIYLNMVKINKLITVPEIVTETADDEAFEPDDKQQRLLDKVKELSYTKRELLELNYDMSLRDIQNKYGINYVYAHRKIHEARKHILNGDMHLYKNKRLKHMKKTNKN